MLGNESDQARYSSISLTTGVRAVLDRLEALATQPAAPETIVAVLARRFALFPQPERPESEWDAWWYDYVQTLDGLAESAIEAAMLAYVKLPDSEFFPKPGRIRELAFTAPNDAARAFFRARTFLTTIAWQEANRQRALNEPEEAAPEQRTEATLQSVQNMLKGYREKMAERSAMMPKPPPGPYIGGPADERGITPLMRAWIARSESAG